MNKTVTSVGIIGCGWLGSALALKLQEANIDVLGTRSNEANAAELNRKGINTSVLSLPTSQEIINSHPVFNQQCIVIAITPQFRKGREDYAEKVKQLVIAAQESSMVEKVILLSSTAVYNGLSGVVTESSELNKNAEKVAILHEAEQSVLNFNTLLDDNPKRCGYVLRLSGLVGPNRHPGKFLSNGRTLKDPNAIVNLIHQEDAVGLILSILASDLSGNIFNGVSETRVTKQAYYQAAAKALALPLPNFESNSDSDSSLSKVVSSEKASASLSYHFIHDDLLKWLECAVN